MTVQVTSRDDRTFTLTGGVFSGALGQLVCNGSIHKPGIYGQNGKGDGTWTDTSGGPLP